MIQPEDIVMTDRGPGIVLSVAGRDTWVRVGNTPVVLPTEQVKPFRWEDHPTDPMTIWFKDGVWYASPCTPTSIGPGQPTGKGATANDAAADLMYMLGNYQIETG